MTEMELREVPAMPLLPRLVSPEELRNALGDERVRVFDATVFLRRAADGGPGRIPGSVNVPWNGLVDPATNLVTG